MRSGRQEFPRGAHMRPSVAAPATLALVLAVALAGHTQLGKSSAAHAPAAASKHYVLPATPENVQWGWYDPGEKPRLVINSGDTVSIETISHSLGQIKRSEERRVGKECTE